MGDLIDTIEYDYPTFHLSMDCFWAEIISGKIVLKEAESAKWLIRDELDSIQWASQQECDKQHHDVIIKRKKQISLMAKDVPVLQ